MNAPLRKLRLRAEQSLQPDREQQEQGCSLRDRRNESPELIWGYMGSGRRTQDENESWKKHSLLRKA